MKSFIQHLNEGGGFGHLNSPHHVGSFTLGQLTEIITNAFTGKIESVAEKCLSGDSIIVVDGENKSIKEVVDDNIGENILSYNVETDSFEEKPILNRVNNGIIEDWIVIETEDGKEIKVTPSHRIYTKNRGYVKAEELTTNDLLVVK